MCCSLKKSTSKKAGQLSFMSPAGGRIFLTANIEVNGPLWNQSNTCSFSTIFSSRLLVIAPPSCWSGFVAPSPGWRTGPQRTPCRPCSRSWRTSGTTAACTSPPRSRRSANLRSISTPCRPSWGSATGRPSCPPKGKWSRWVRVTASVYPKHA